MVGKQESRGRLLFVVEPAVFLQQIRGGFVQSMHAHYHPGCEFGPGMITKAFRPNRLSMNVENCTRAVLG